MLILWINKEIRQIKKLKIYPVNLRVCICLSYRRKSLKSIIKRSEKKSAQDINKSVGER